MECITACALQLGGTGRIPAGATASIELSGPDARATNNPGYYQHSAESKALADVSPTNAVSPAAGGAELAVHVVLVSVCNASTCLRTFACGVTHCQSF